MFATTRYIFFFAMLITAAFSCKHKPDKVADTPTPVVFKGLYSFSPGAKTFQACGGQTEFWVADSSAQLELRYSQMVSFEKTEPVYIEVEGKKIKTAASSDGAAYDSTLIVKKLINITKDIPADCK